MKIQFSEFLFGKSCVGLKASAMVGSKVYSVQHIDSKNLLESFKNEKLKTWYWDKLKIKLSHDLSYFIVYSDNSSSSRR
jgi:hypothetical protein